jgi:hypothetical protein
LDDESPPCILFPNAQTFTNPQIFLSRVENEFHDIAANLVNFNAHCPITVPLRVAPRPIRALCCGKV